ncbi:hypothetical protein SEVIR_2G441250v4 [Setaria viridis]
MTGGPSRRGDNGGRRRRLTLAPRASAAAGLPAGIEESQVWDASFSDSDGSEGDQELGSRCGVLDESSEEEGNGRVRRRRQSAPFFNFSPQRTRWPGCEAVALASGRWRRSRVRMRRRSGVRRSWKKSRRRSSCEMLL